MNLFDRLNIWWLARAKARRQARCAHTFRPAKVKGKPARFCPRCQQMDSLTPAEFYQQFGERGWQW